MRVTNFGKGVFEAHGGKVLGTEHVKEYENDPHASDPDGVTFTIENGITDVEAGVFDIFPTLQELYIPESVKSFALSEETIRIFKNNHVLMHGVFDSFAEKLAREYGLRFLHSDIEIARTGDYNTKYGANIITIKLYESGKPTVKQSNYCPGSSAGNNGGGDMCFSLPKNFYRIYSQHDIAKMCWGSCYSAIMANGALMKFLAKARKKKGYCFDFR